MTEPYRSPDAPAAPPPRPAGDIDTKISPRRRPWLRLGLLTVLLMVMVYAVAQLILGPGAPAFGPVAIWVAVGVVALLAIVTGFTLRRTLRLVHENNDAVLLIAAGRLDEAIVAFERLAERSKRLPAYRAQFLANLGTAWLRKGEIERALKFLRAAHESRWFDAPRQGRNAAVLLNSLAVCHAVRNQIDAARQYQRDAAVRVPPAHRGLLLLGDALVAARAGDFGEVDAMATSRWSEGEGVLPPFQMRVLRLLRAFALDRLDGVANAKQIGSLVEGARPSKPGEFDYLIGSWPEFRDFLVAHGFGPTA